MAYHIRSVVLLPLLFERAFSKLDSSHGHCKFVFTLTFANMLEIYMNVCEKLFYSGGQLLMTVLYCSGYLVGWLHYGRADDWKTIVPWK